MKRQLEGLIKRRSTLHSTWALMVSEESRVGWNSIAVSLKHQIGSYWIIRYVFTSAARNLSDRCEQIPNFWSQKGLPLDIKDILCPRMKICRRHRLYFHFAKG